MSATSGITADADLLARFAAATAADPATTRFLRIRIADGASPARNPALADPPQMPSSTIAPLPPAAPS